MNTKKTFLIYGLGWIGSLLKQYLEEAGHNVEVGEGDINSVSFIPGNIDVVINTAASTNIDWCEAHKTTAFWNNVLGSVNLAKVCRDTCKYVFFSSACIFKSYPEFVSEEEAKTAQHFVEEDKPNPQCFYTETKVMAEKLIREVCPNSLILRPRLPISEKSHPRNTLDKLLSYEKLNENQESITVLEDMFPIILELVNEDKRGTFHLVNEGTISPKEFGEKLGHKFEVQSKAEQDQEMRKAGKAVRVTSYISSNKTDLLPNIRDRIDDIIRKFNASRGNPDETKKLKVDKKKIKKVKKQK